MGCRQKWRAVLVVDVDRRCAHAHVPQACRDNVPVAAVCLLEGRTELSVLPQRVWLVRKLKMQQDCFPGRDS